MEAEAEVVEAVWKLTASTSLVTHQQEIKPIKNILHFFPNWSKSTGLHGKFVNYGEDVCLNVSNVEINNEDGANNKTEFKETMRHNVASPSSSQIQDEIYGQNKSSGSERK